MAATCMPGRPAAQHTTPLAAVLRMHATAAPALHSEHCQQLPRLFFTSYGHLNVCPWAPPTQALAPLAP